MFAFIFESIASLFSWQVFFGIYFLAALYSVLIATVGLILVGIEERAIYKSAFVFYGLAFVPVVNLLFPIISVAAATKWFGIDDAVDNALDRMDEKPLFTFNGYQGNLFPPTKLPK